jgi:hypothetical protein
MTHYKRCTSCEQDIEFTVLIQNGNVTAVEGPEACPICDTSINHDLVALDALEEHNHQTQ